MIYIKRSVIDSKMAKLVMSENSNYEIVDTDLEVMDTKTNILLDDRVDNYIRLCPGTKIYRCCSYHNIDIMQGCPFDCSYCILQAYLDHKFIKVSTDIDSIIEHIRSEKRKIRLGSGELTDSLAVDHIVPFTKLLIPIVNDLDNLQLEFKTKSSNIANLLNLNPKNIVVSFSLNPQIIIDNEEHRTASLSKRLAAAKTLSEYGYRVGFHFDPLISDINFTSIYTDLVDMLVEEIDPLSVEFISISSFRATSELFSAIKLRSNYTSLLLSDLIKSPDGKFRYYKAERIKMLKTVYNRLSSRWQKVFIYLCMEHSSVWEKVIGYDPGERDEFEKGFPYTFFT